jgi:hypothetical protein
LRRATGLLALIVILFMSARASLAAPAAEHKLGESYVFLYIHPDRIDVRLEVATKDLNEYLGFGYGETEPWSRASIARHVDSVRTYLDPLWSFSIDGQKLDFQHDSVSQRYTEVTQYMLLYYSVPISERPDEIAVDYRILFDYDSKHRGLLVVTQDFQKGTIDNGEMASLFFGKNSSTQVLDLTGGAWFRGFWTFIVSGAWHIWIGIDHVLFLLALLLPAVLQREREEWEPVESFRMAFINVLKIVTVFTVAHSLTLVAASLGVVNLSSRIVESIIALSIAIAAFDILKPVLHRRILVVVFVFGLFHGFGFANVLGHVGLKGNQLLLSLFGFNVGVELGQITIVVIAFPILYAIRRTRFYRKVFLPVAAVVLIGLSFLWVSERFFGVDVRIRDTLMTLIGR